jgi:hypothetical protein
MAPNLGLNDELPHSGPGGAFYAPGAMHSKKLKLHEG